MDEHLIPLDPALLGDAALVARAREGDRIAFGVLYLRHHAAAWRVACVVSGFSDDAEVALIDGFSAVFGALPRDLHNADFRPYLLACVRQAALDRAGKPGTPSAPGARARRRSQAARPPLEPVERVPNEVVLGELEHHLVRTVLRRLPERWRTALWLADAEAMTPAEVAAILDLDLAAVTAVTAGAREQVREACLRAHQRSARAECRFTVDHLDAYLGGGLGRHEQVLVAAHVEECVACGMRQAEFGNVTGSLLAAVTPPPLLGGECQRHWLATMTAGRAAPPAGRRALSPAKAAARTRTAALRWSVSPSLAVAAAALAAFLGVPRLIPPAPPIRHTPTAMSSPVFRATLPPDPVPARRPRPPAEVVTELVALAPPIEPTPEAAAPAAPVEALVPSAPPAAEAPTPPPAPAPVPPLQVTLPPPPPLPALLPAPVALPEPTPLPPVADRPGKGRGDAKGQERKQPTTTLTAAALNLKAAGKSPGQGKKGHRA